jgi:outer membrane protein assembly factor BamB
MKLNAIVPAGIMQAALISACIVLMTNAAVHADDWTMQRTVYWGMSHWLHYLSAPDLHPESAIYDGGNTYPMVVQNILIAQGFAHSAAAYAKDTGKRLWRVKSWRGVAHCLVRTTDGVMLDIESAPVPQELIGIDVSTGVIRWRYPLVVGSYPSGDYSGLAAGSGRFVYVPGWHEHLPGGKPPRGGLYCIDASTGKPAWKYERKAMRGERVLIAGNAVYFDGSDGFLYKFTAVRLCAR